LPEVQTGTKDNDMSHLHTDIASDYFDYLAQAFPVMCASDEFHFLPRASQASRYYDTLDSLDAELIAERISRLKAFRKTFELRTTHETDLENIIDLALLRANVNGILIELDLKQSWRHNPLLYLKIAFIGLDHALIRPAQEKAERTERALARLAAIPKLLKQAMGNLENVPMTYYQAGRAMARDCRDYLKELLADSEGKLGPESSEPLQTVQSALDAFDGFLRGLAPMPDEAFPVSPFEVTLRHHFLSKRNLDEIFEIAEEEWNRNLEALQALRKKIDPRKSWQELYHAYEPFRIEETGTMSLYREEIDRLSGFFGNQGFVDVDSSRSLELCETPTYLRSVRSAASFSAALRSDTGEKDLFYITTRPGSRQGRKQDNALLRKRLHREYKFLSAHETIPGHHLLDGVRRRLANPVRRQTESPLFYEGWAYYAESLLTDYGYVTDPMECLVDTKRRLWRAARCLIDVGLPTHRLTRQGGVELLLSAGFHPEEANAQIDRFRLNPAYQLCYSLGRHEIVRLREMYGPRMSRDQFHRQLLEGGELPFHLVEERLEASLRRL